jgi:cell division septal protein FtsQ
MCLLGLFALVAAFLLLSDAFYVYDVSASGLQVVSPERVLAASGVEGFNVFFLRREDIAARVKTIPEVKDAGVQVRLPNRVLIRIEERQPTAIWQRGNVQMWVDPDGIVLPVQGDLPEAPVITDSSAGALTQGQSVDKTAVRSALDYARLIPDARRFQYTAGIGISMVTAKGWPVHLGTSDEAELKVFVWREITQWLEKRGIRPSYIDVRVPTAPTFSQ